MALRGGASGEDFCGQAERKEQFALIAPLLEQGMIQPKTETKRAGKNRKTIKQVLTNLREANSDGGNAVELQSLIEQACNFYLQNGCFPEMYEEMQSSRSFAPECCRMQAMMGIGWARLTG